MYNPKHAISRVVERLSWPARTGILAGAAAGALALSAFTLAPIGGAATSTTTYAKAGSYQFASNEANGNWQMSDTPISDPAGSESLGSGGVMLTASGNNSAKYGTAAVVYPLGKLSTLFDSSGNYVPPTIKSTGATPYVNFYVDANGDGYPLSFSYNGAVYEGPGGDNLFIPPSTSGGTIDTNGWQQGNTLVSNGQTMKQVQADYAKDTATTDPEVWASVGVQSGNTTTVTATVSAVGGHALVKAVTSLAYGEVIGYAGRCLDNWHSSQANGTKADLYYCNGTNAQQWAYDASTGHLINKTSGKCLNDAGYGGQGAHVIQWTCGNYSNEHWTLTSARQMKLPYGNLCLNDPGYSRTAGVQQIVWACGNYANEKYSMAN